MITVCFWCSQPNPIWCPEPYPCEKWDPIKVRPYTIALPNVNEKEEA